MWVPPSGRQYDFVRLVSAFPLPCFSAETAFETAKKRVDERKNPMMARV
jgi:hypothetical protein